MTYTETITLNQDKATVEVRETYGIDLLDAIALYPMLTYKRTSARERQRAESFMDAFQRSTVTGDLGFTWPEDDTDQGALQAAFESWQKLSRLDFVAWFNALDRVNKKALNPNSSPPKDGGG